jgi:hypothetical protein
MLRPLTGWLLATLVALTPGVVDGGGAGSSRCSIIRVPGIRGVTETILLATARADTVLAGPGGVEPSPHGGHSGAGGPGPIHGQVFDVARFAGVDSARLARTFRMGGAARAVIVPWDYDPACQPARWTAGAAWVPPAEPGAFTLQLRPESEWVDGMPVFDAFRAVLEPYPFGEYERSRSIPRQNPSRARTAGAMTAAQYFELLSELRPRDDLRDQPDSVWSALLRWQGRHPELVELYPANEIAASLADDVSRAKARRVLRSIDPVIAGTYRMTASLTAAPDRSFYIRTRAGPMDEWQPRPRPPLPGPLQDPEPPDGYSVLATGAPTLAMLPTDCRTGSAAGGQAYMYVLDPPSEAGAPRREWRGWIGPNLVARQFPDDTAHARFARQAFDEWSRRRRADGEREAPARFRLDDGGTLRVEQTTRLADGRTLTVQGERVSSAVESCER